MYRQADRDKQTEGGGNKGQCKKNARNVDRTHHIGVEYRSQDGRPEGPRGCRG